MPLLVLFVVALGVASRSRFVAWHYPMPVAAPTPSLAAAKAVGREIGHHSRLRRTIKSRLNPEVATGLALTIALGAHRARWHRARVARVPRADETHSCSTSTRASPSGAPTTQAR